VIGAAAGRTARPGQVNEVCVKASGLARLRPAGSEVRINTAIHRFAGNKPD